MCESTNKQTKNQQLSYDGACPSSFTPGQDQVKIAAQYTGAPPD